MNIEGANIVLTGAGSGIGRALAQALAAKGGRLLLAGRNQETLEQTRSLTEHPERVTAFGADVTQAADRKALVDMAEKEFGSVNMLINNAGVVEVGPLAETSDEALAAMAATNLLGPMALCRDFTPLLKKAGSARIVNVGSMFGDIAFPLFAGYSATKFGLRGFSDALRRELKADGIGVTYAAPRATRTGASAAFDHLVEPMKMTLDAPETVARQIAAAVEKDARSVYPKGPERLFVLVQRLFPAMVDKDVVKQLAGVGQGR